jgi:hypothetical protein
MPFSFLIFFYFLKTCRVQKLNRYPPVINTIDSLNIQQTIDFGIYPRVSKKFMKNKIKKSARFRVKGMLEV